MQVKIEEAQLSLMKIHKTDTETGLPLQGHVQQLMVDLVSSNK